MTRFVGLLLIISVFATPACTCGHQGLTGVHSRCEEDPTQCGGMQAPPPCGVFGSVKGRVCATDQMTWVNGAAVTLGATDCNDQPITLSATTAADGSFTLGQIPPGTWTLHASLGAFTQDIPVTVTANQTFQVPDNQLCVQQKAVKIAVVTGSGDKIESLLDTLQLQYTLIAGDGTNWAAHADPFFADLTQMKQYDLIFIDCAAAHSSSGSIDFGSNAATIESNLNAYIKGGGSLYASDWALLFPLYAAPGSFSFVTASPQALIDPMPTTDLVGYAPQLLNANLVDPGLQAFLGKSGVSINFPKQTGAVSTHWGMMTAVPGAQVLVQADNVATCGNSSCSSMGQVHNTVPLAVRVKLTPEGQHGGSVVYTSFHNIAQSGPDVAQILKYLVLNL
jgi:hypothetical protein